MQLKPKASVIKEAEEKRKIIAALYEDIAKVTMSDEQKRLSVLLKAAKLAHKNWRCAEDAYLSAVQEYEQKQKQT
jgi:hypothetical protein